MPLNHLNLPVANLPAATAFFETYFHFTCTETKGDHIKAILKDAHHFTLVLMKQKEGTPAYPDAFHLGFMQDSEQAVLEKYAQLQNGGIAIGQPPRKIRDSFGFYFTFDGLMIEVGNYIPVTQPGT